MTRLESLNTREGDMHTNLPQTMTARAIPPQCRMFPRGHLTAEDSLIYAVYKRRPLWDPRVHFYRNNTVVKLLWEEVAQETGITDSQARSRWKSLRDYYRIELKKMLITGGKEAKQSNWMHFQSMSFIRELMTESMLANNKINEHNDDSSTEEEGVQQLRFKSEDKANLNEDDKKHIPLIEDRHEKMIEVPDHIMEQVSQSGSKVGGGVDSTCFMECESSEPKHSQLRSRNMLKIRPNFELAHRKALLQLENRRLELLEKAAKMEEDDDLLFFRSLLPMIKTLPQKRRMLMRLKFQEIVNIEIENMDRSTT